jgi:hypothetical protein
MKIDSWYKRRVLAPSPPAVRPPYSPDNPVSEPILNVADFRFVDNAAAVTDDSEPLWATPQPAIFLPLRAGRVARI